MSVQMRGADGRLTSRGRDRVRDDVQRSLIKALAGLYDERGDLAMTLLETGRALYGIAELDETGSAHEKVQAWLAATPPQPEPPPPPDRAPTIPAGE